MSRIRGKNTNPEMRFRRALWKAGVRYRVDSKLLPGKPDVSIKNTNWLFLLMANFGMVIIGTSVNQN